MTNVIIWRKLRASVADKENNLEMIRLSIRSWNSYFDDEISTLQQA
jgi:hypothetical protein